MRLLVLILILAVLWPGFAPAQDAEDDFIPNLLEQLEKESAKSQPEPAPLSPVLKDPLLGKDKKPLPYKSFDEIPQEVIAEAEQIKGICQAHHRMSIYYECECWAMRFLEQRLVRGPDMDARIVMLDIQAECPNMPAIAGYAYQSCISQGIDFFPKDQDPEEYCGCIGNSYAKLYARSGRRISSRLAIQLRTIAALSCTKQQPGVPPLVAPIQ